MDSVLHGWGGFRRLVIMVEKEIGTIFTGGRREAGGGVTERERERVHVKEELSQTLIKPSDFMRTHYHKNSMREKRSS